MPPDTPAYYLLYALYACLLTYFADDDAITPFTLEMIVVIDADTMPMPLH